MCSPKNEIIVKSELSDDNIATTSATTSPASTTVSPTTSPIVNSLVPFDCELKLEERRLYMKRRGLAYVKSGALTHMDGEQLLKRKSDAKLAHTSFLQEADCLTAAPKLLKCRECKAGPKSGNIFCRFYAFRRFFIFF